MVILKIYQNSKVLIIRGSFVKRYIRFYNVQTSNLILDITLKLDHIKLYKNETLYETLKVSF